MRVRVLGAFEVTRGDEVVPVPGARARGLLTRLALAGGSPVEAGALVDALWPEERPADPANALQSLVSRLRRMLGAAGTVTQTDGGGYRLDVAAGDVDALRFERLAADGRDRLRAGDPSAAIAVLREAVDCWAGHPGGEPALIAAVAPAVATRLARERADTEADLGEAELALGRAAAAATVLSALLAENPLDERAAGLLMDALAAQGRQAEALALFERVREALADRLGVDPGVALRERHLRMLRTPEPSTGPADSPAPISRPIRSNLPAPVTSFVGRDDDLGRIDTLLAAGRLVTVLGPGGAGKTRLALEAARRRRHEFRDGVWLVDLAAVTEAAKVSGAVLAAIGLRGAALFDTSGKIWVEGDDVDVLVEELNSRESLLVVDNCEHLIDAVAYLIAALLPRCSQLRVLATSREPLAVDGEALVPLGPLTLPEPADDVAEARRTASVRLFTERAAAVRPGFDVDPETLGDVVRIVRGLDGMPLALELAAARLRTLSLAELAAGLSDRFRLLTTGSRTAYPRHRTLRAVIAWSWDLLTEPERTVAERVSVLPGGVTEASATAICADTRVPAAEVPELLAALVDKSLLHLAADAGRYRMLETLREYGIERLAEQGTLRTTRDLAAGYLAELVARLDPRLRGPDQLAAIAALSSEYDNALAALRHLIETGDGDAAGALGLNLAWYWQMFGRHAEAAYWLEQALALPGGPSIDRDCAEAIMLLNQISYRGSAMDEVNRAREAELRALADRLTGYPELPGFAAALAAMTLAFLERFDDALTIIDRLIDGPDPWVCGLARMFRAQFAENNGDVGQLRVDVEGALDAFGRVGDRWGLATSLPMRAQLRQYDGDLDGALTDLSRARSMAREFGSLSLSDEIFIDLRWIDLYMRRGETEAAIEMIGGTRDRAMRSGSSEMIILVDALEAGLWLRLDDLDRARELVEVAEAGMAAGLPFAGDHGTALIGGVRAMLCIKLGDDAGAAVALERAYAAAVESRDMPILSMTAVTGAALAEARGRHREAALLLGAASRLRGTHDRTDPHVRELAQRGREALGEDGFAEAYETGWMLEPKTASARVDPARLRQEALPGPDR
ncbi:winged helix-turn-helix domain-containing protein [Actinoplanes sp. KI2]|uniref:BTAD domain-containing putative transcriptional regulator n=1 Tax=Actinoplanes sp. KI2 TaxID=2983315 RepID=UPI0021D595FF|nr:BTAD domain-containing putative transcriptional regulator [Actinoplanes sp. KI2]MCU7727955.1 winged helix-turn-helix domain-containing protein [Actinoplanes sp. KI2]